MTTIRPTAPVQPRRGRPCPVRPCPLQPRPVRPDAAALRELQLRHLTAVPPTSPDSHFTRSVVCSWLTDEGRVTLSGRTLVMTVRGERSEVPLATDAEVLDAYREHFGLRLHRLPTVHQVEIFGRNS